MNLQFTDERAGSAFSLEVDAGDGDVVNLLVSPPGSHAEPVVLWSRRFEIPEDRNAVLNAIYTGDIDLTFLGRLTVIFGKGEFDEIADGIVRDAARARQTAAKKAADRARKHQIVTLYLRSDKGRYSLELQRKSRDTAEWKVAYNRAAERDRLCDWLCRQQPRYLSFLDYAAEHGDEALTRLLTDEMFETERRVKKEGRGAGGMRPLRMWRGD